MPDLAGEIGQLSVQISGQDEMCVEDHTWHCQLEFFNNTYHVWEGEMGKSQEATNTPKSNKCDCPVSSFLN